MTLDEQIAGLEAVPTADAVQFKAKATVIHTLRQLKAMRSQFEQGTPSTDKLVHILLEILGEHPPHRQPSS